jgi:hypothetical protein
MNKWKAIPVAKVVRVVMRFQGVVALGVVLSVTTPELMNLGSTPHTLNDTTKGVDQRTGKIALEEETSGTDDRLVPPRYLVVDNDKIQET